MSVLRGIIVVLFLLFPASLAMALEGFAPIELTGIGSASITLSAGSLSGVPVVEKDVSFQTSKGPSNGHYKGVLLWEFLTANKAFEGLERNGELKKTILVSAADGYQIAFSVGEIHPDFGNVPMIFWQRRQMGNRLNACASSCQATSGARETSRM